MLQLIFGRALNIEFYKLFSNRSAYLKKYSSSYSPSLVVTLSLTLKINTSFIPRYIHISFSNYVCTCVYTIHRHRWRWRTDTTDYLMLKKGYGWNSGYICPVSFTIAALWNPGSGSERGWFSRRGVISKELMEPKIAVKVWPKDKIWLQLDRSDL